MLGMLAHCFFCDRPFHQPSVQRAMQRGGAIAYDPHRGRLWMVCAACRRWSLTPIEDRWETLEQLEQIKTDCARLLAETANIALLDAEGLRLVRVGRAGLREEAWWRYGRELYRRHQRSMRALGRGAVLDTLLDGATPILAFLLAGWPFRRMIEPGIEPWLDRARWLDFGPFAWRGTIRCRVCGSTRRDLLLTETEDVAMRPAMDTVVLRVRCAQCRSLSEPQSGFHLEGVQAMRVLRRMLAYQNYDGASERQIDVAMTMIEDAGSPEMFSRQIARRGVRLGLLKSRELLALEIATNEEDERRMAEQELSALERVWRKEEGIAALADGELTPWPV